jgi:hypothetical protein
MNTVQEKDILLKFLEDLSGSIKDGKINREEILLLCEFYYKFKFSKENHHTEKDLLKYLSLGYYMYSFVEKED